MAKLPVHMQHAVKRPEVPAVFDPAKELDALTELAMRRKREILELDWPSGKDAGRLQALISSVAESTINQKIKVDETALQAQRSAELLPELLKRIEAALKG